MNLTVTFLGTSAALPTQDRNVSSTAIQLGRQTLLVDCGEGTQQRMLKYNVPFTVSEIFFTHFHSDHILGLPGLLKTMDLQKRKNELTIWGSPGLRDLVLKFIDITFPDRPPGFYVNTIELAANQQVNRKGYSFTPFQTAHRCDHSFGYLFREDDRKGKFDPIAAELKGVPMGPMWKKLQDGDSVLLDDGRIVFSSQIVGPSQPGRSIAISGDTQPWINVETNVIGVDLLIHDSTFRNEHKGDAITTGHSTSIDAAQIALYANVRQLVLTHISARYSPEEINSMIYEAQAVFCDVIGGYDGLKIEVPYAD